MYWQDLPPYCCGQEPLCQTPLQWFVVSIVLFIWLYVLARPPAILLRNKDPDIMRPHTIVWVYLYMYMYLFLSCVCVWGREIEREKGRKSGREREEDSQQRERKTQREKEREKETDRENEREGESESESVCKREYVYSSVCVMPLFHYL